MSTSNHENIQPEAPANPQPSRERQPADAPPADTGGAAADGPGIPRETPRDQRNRYSGGRTGNS